MRGQLDLEFPMARASDPVTSHEAADRALASGAVPSQREAVLRFVRGRPGATATELARLLHHETNHITCRRLPELERRGLVRRGPARVCQVTNFKAATWFPTERSSQ